MIKNIDTCALDGVTECDEDCVKCKLAELKSEGAWLRQMGDELGEGE